MGFQDGFNRQPREMHKAVCSDCKKECEVPFKPNGARPIYCKDCYSKRKDSGR
jgi:CxxC-x17-CxxC domain-containing protein